MDNLTYTVIKCPICNKKLRNGSKVDINKIGWVCSHADFDVKIYLEFNK